MTWESTPLSEVVKVRRGHDLPTRVRKPGLIPVVSSGGVSGYHDTAIADGPGVVLGRATNLGQPTWVDGPYWPHNTTLYVEDFLGNDPRWVYWWFKTNDLSGFNSGSVQPMLNRNYIAKVPVSLPPLEEQERIAGVLGAFDDLIETNRHLAGKMRDSAQWAARGALAGRARTVPLTDLATVDKGFSYKSAELEGDEMVLLNLKNAGRGGHFRRDGYKPLSTTRHKPGHVVQAGDVIVAMTDLTQDRDIVARPLSPDPPSEVVPCGAL